MGDDASSLTVHFFSFFFSSIRKHVDVENAKTQVEKRKCAKCPTCERCAARFNLKRVAGKKGSKEKKKQVFSRLATTPSPAVHSPARVASQSATMQYVLVGDPSAMLAHMQLAFSP